MARRNETVFNQIARKAVDNVRDDDGRYRTTDAVSELLTLADMEPYRDQIHVRWLRMGAMKDVQSVPQAAASERVQSAIQQLTLRGIKLNEDISVPQQNGQREYVQLLQALPEEMEAAGRSEIDGGMARIAKGEALIELAHIVRDIGGNGATLESLIRDGKITDDDVQDVRERLA